MFQESPELFNKSKQEIIKNVCIPLQEYGIDTFFYTKLNVKDLNFFSLCTYHEWAIEFWRKKYFDTTKFLQSLANSQSTGQYHIVSPKIDVSNKFDVYNMVSHFDCHDNYIENWGFACSRYDTDIINFYINHQSDLRNFFLYFKFTIKDIIAFGEKNNIFYKNIISDRAAIFPEISDRKLFKLPKMQLVHKGKTIILPAKQFECIHLYSLGFSMKEIAHKLAISFKTVEYHITQTKLKFGCNFKTEIIDIMRKNYVI